MRRLRLCCALTLSTLAAGALLAEQGKDHPLISRFPGSEIQEYAVAEFDEYVLPLGPTKDTDSYTKSQKLEGKVTKIKYSVPENRSSLEVFRNFQNALQRGGFQTLFTCSGKECLADRSFSGHYVSISGIWGDFEGTMRYLAAKLTRPSGDVYVSLDVLEDNRYWMFEGIWLNVVEVKPMEEGLVTIKSAETLNSDIGSTGHSAVYGVYFDTGKAIVKPESDPTLAEIVKLLKADPAMKLYVVGHTDNVGTFAFNMTLSKQRADAVVAALVTKYKIPAARLDAAGDGPTSPVTTNRTEEGRAKNRRVELVEQ